MLFPPGMGATANRGGYLLHKTEGSNLMLATAATHELDCEHRFVEDVIAEPDMLRLTIAARVPAGESLTLTKFVAYGWSGTRTAPALRDQVQAALITAVMSGWDRLAGEQREVLDEFWAGADVEVDGADEIQQAAFARMTLSNS